MPEWYETFFGPLALEFWDKAVPEPATAEEVAFLVRNLGVAPPARLLDLPCGLGRHALALAGSGYRVTGIDLAQGAVESARSRARELGIEAEFLAGDMRSPPPGGPYDGACCLGNSFGYLAHEDTRRFVRNVFQAVRPGARWIIDTGTTAESLFANLPQDRRLEAGGIVFSVRNSYDAVSGRLNQACLLEKGPVRQEAEVSYGIYTVAELHRLLAVEGWNVEGAYGSLDGRPFQLGDRRLLLVAQRR